MCSATVFIGLGSNLDDPVAQVEQALEELERVPGSHCTLRSHLYRSAPMGPQDQPDYINAVAALETSLDPVSLLDALQEIEQRHGRVRKGKHWGPRTLDLDLLLYGEQCINSSRLQVPHPGLRERGFVLVPLYEIAPELVLPGGESLGDLMQRVNHSGLKRL